MKRIYITFLILLCVTGTLFAQTAPAAYGPTPNARQMKYLQNPLAGFIHFGMNTYAGTDGIEWGNDVKRPASTFNPTNGKVNTDQWVRLFQKAGFKKVILVAKHHDGFCIWPSAYTDYDIAASPYLSGQGDIVKQLSESCDKYGMDMGIYLSPWDAWDTRYGADGGTKTNAYNTYYKNQLTELLSGNYGRLNTTTGKREIAEIWLDGATGTTVTQAYDLDGYISIVRTLQPNCVIWMDSKWQSSYTGTAADFPLDAMWVGNEEGKIADPAWNTIDVTKTGTNQGRVAGGKYFCVNEADVSIRPGWFYHSAEDNGVKGLQDLTNIYYNTVGMGIPLLLNVPPNKAGVFHANDSIALIKFKDEIARTFSTNLITPSMTVTASTTLGTAYAGSKAIDADNATYWTTSSGTKTGNIVIDFGKTMDINVVKIQEYMPLGQRVSGFKVELNVGGTWVTFGTGQTIGQQRIVKGDTKSATMLRLSITGSLAVPLISNVEAYCSTTEAVPTGLDYTNADFFQTIATQNIWKLQFRVDTRTSGKWPSIAEMRFFTHVNGIPQEIDRSSISSSATSYAQKYTAQGSFPASNTLDGNTATFWQPEWYPSEVSMPVTVEYNFGKSVQCTEISYLPRQDASGNVPATFSILTATTSTGSFTEKLTGATLSSATSLAQNNAIATNYWTVIQNYIALGVGVAIQSGNSAAYAQFGVTGGWFKLIGTKGPDQGIMKVYIDGVEKATVDNYAATTATDQVLYEFDGLSSAVHLVKVTVTGTKNPLATNNLITLQKKYQLSSTVNGIFQMEKAQVDVRKDAATVTVKVIRSGSAETAAAVNIATSPGTGVHGMTYDNLSSTLSFAVGEKEKTFTVTLLNNELTEEKTFYVGLSNPTNSHLVGETNKTMIVVSPAYYRSKASGNWGTAATWEASSDNTTFATATSAPNASATRISILNGHEVTIGANTTATGLVINAGGKLTLNDTFTLNTSSLTIESNAANGTGTFVDKNTNGGLTVSGSSQVNQYLTYRTWYLSSPVVSATPTGMSKVKYYNEANNTWPEITATPTMTVGKGYLVIPVSGNSIRFTGSLNNGNQSIPLTRSAGNTFSPGFNLIGNPYPSYLDWTKVSAANTAVMPTTTMWYRTKVGSAYTFYTVNGSGVGTPTTASKNIPPMQGFWVRTKSGGGNLALTNDMRLHESVTTNLLRAPAAKSSELQLVRLEVSNGSNTDETVIYASGNAFNDLDIYDSPKMSNENPAIPEIYTTLDNQQIVINAMNSLPLDTEIGLGFVPGDSTSFTLKANEISNLPPDVKVILKDNANNGKETDLTDGVTAYQFSPATTTGNRFSIIFRNTGTVTGVDENTDNGVVVYSTQRNIHVTVNSSLDENATVKVYNSLGQQLASQALTCRSTIVDGNFRDGVYVVKVTNGGILGSTQKIVIR